MAELRRGGQGSRPGAQACAHRSSGEVVPEWCSCCSRHCERGWRARADFGPHPSASSYVHAGLPHPSPRRKPSVSTAYDLCHSASPLALASPSPSPSRSRTSAIGIWRAFNRIDFVIDVLSSPSPRPVTTTLHRARTQSSILSRTTVRHTLPKSQPRAPINRSWRAHLCSRSSQMPAPDPHRSRPVVRGLGVHGIGS
ncbi:hypothetical protein C8Q70DRAFT_354021 [Cubamyces menziesii]|nr:hypothetical protein C8Q70DRAFT_354021 [Cubamyces menziesii]